MKWQRKSEYLCDNSDRVLVAVAQNEVYIDPIWQLRHLLESQCTSAWTVQRGGPPLHPLHYDSITTFPTVLKPILFIKNTLMWLTARMLSVNELLNERRSHE